MKQAKLDPFESVFQESRRVLRANPRVLRRKVRCVIDDDSDEAQAIFNIAAGHKFDWTPLDWQAVLDTLQYNDASVETWLTEMERAHERKAKN